MTLGFSIRCAAVEAKKLFDDFCSYSLQLLWVFCVLMKIIIPNVTCKTILINQTLLGHASHGLSSTLSLTIGSSEGHVCVFGFPSVSEDAGQ